MDELVEPREVLEQLTDSEAEVILELLRTERTRQQASLTTAIDDALEVLPRLIRIPARKILFGR